MGQFLAGFALCYLIGGLATVKFISDYYASQLRKPPRRGWIKVLALWPVMLAVIGKD